MSIVASLPQGGPPTPSPAESLNRARNAADAAYQRFLAGRGGAAPGQVLPLRATPVEIPCATFVQPAGDPIATSWLAPPGANYPIATAVAAVPATAMVAAPTPGFPCRAALTSAVPPVQALSSVPTPGSFPPAVMRQSSTAQPLTPQPSPTVLMGGTPEVMRQLSVAQQSPRLNGAQSPYQPLLPGALQPQPLLAAPGAAPMLMAPGAQQMVTPSLPPRPTQPIPDPAAVDIQNKQQIRNLFDRLQSDTAVLTQQNQVRKAMLAQYGAQQKAQHATQVDSDLQREAMAVEQRGNAQLLQAQQAIMAQTMALEQQAAGLTLRYQCQLVEEDRLQKDYNIQRQYYESEMKILGQMQKLVREGQQATAPQDSSILGSERNTFRDTNSFDAYLGNPGGIPQPRRGVSSN